jgi:hypothetical protein
VSCGALYSDPNSKIAREVDVLESKYARADGAKPNRDLSVQVSLVVECRHVDRRSWVLFSQPAGNLVKHHPLDLLANRLGRKFLEHLPKDPDPLKLSTLADVETVGYYLRAAPTQKGDEVDEAHNGLSQVLSAARA